MICIICLPALSLLNQSLSWLGVDRSRRFDYDRIYKAIATYKPKRALLDPLMLMEMAEGPVDDEFDLSSLDSILCAALPSTNSSAEAFAKRIGCRLQQFWGVGELAPVVAYGCNATMAGIAGSLVPSTAVKIVNESGKSLGPNESGQVLVKGPQVVSRRWNQDNQSLDSAGWLRIGYTGYFDKMGHLHVADFPHDMSEHQLFEEAVILAGRSLVEEAMKKDEPTNPKTGLQFMVESI